MSVLHHVLHRSSAGVSTSGRTASLCRAWAQGGWYTLGDGVWAPQDSCVLMGGRRESVTWAWGRQRHYTRSGVGLSCPEGRERTPITYRSRFIWPHSHPLEHRFLLFLPVHLTIWDPNVTSTVSPQWFKALPGASEKSGEVRTFRGGNATWKGAPLIQFRQCSCPNSPSKPLPLHHHAHLLENMSQGWSPMCSQVRERMPWKSACVSDDTSLSSKT